MANHKSAVKQQRQSQLRRGRNRQKRSRLRTAIKACRQAIEAGDAALAAQLLPTTFSLLDRTEKVGAIHDNAVARTKARLQRAVNRVQSA